MKRIVVGIDGSAASRNALTWTADICERTELALVAARVFEPVEDELTPELAAELRVQQRQELEEWCGQLHVNSSPEAVLLNGYPGDALLAEAHDRGPDLLAVGHGHTQPRHPDLGSLVHYLTQHTTGPLAMAPATTGERLNHIVVAVDGSPGSRNAVAVVADLASRLDIGVTAVFAIEPLIEFVPASHPESWQTDAAAAVDRWTAPLIDRGVHVHIDIDREIRPVAAILRALEAHPGAAACLGLRGLSEVTGIRVGDIARHLLRHTAAGLILIPQAATR